MNCGEDGRRELYPTDALKRVPPHLLVKGAQSGSLSSALCSRSKTEVRVIRKGQDEEGPASARPLGGGWVA
jgi:hypothetical protein